MPIADWAIDHAANDDRTFDILGKLVKFIDFVPTTLHYLPQLRVDRKGYPDGTFRAQDLPDNPDVKYFSFTTSMKSIPAPPPLAASDGIVPEYSMVHGTNQGHLEAYH